MSEEELDFDTIHTLGKGESQHKVKFLTITVSVSPTISECINCGMITNQFDGHISFYSSADMKEKIGGCNHEGSKCLGWDDNIPKCNVPKKE